MQSLVTSSSELCGPEKSLQDSKVPRHVKFAFKSPARCRIIWITLRLPRLGSNSVNLGQEFSLLSMDENPFAEQNRRASFGGESGNDPYIHAKRVLVVGRTVRREIGASPQGSDQMNVRNWLERPPQLNRFKVKEPSDTILEVELSTFLHFWCWRCFLVYHNNFCAEHISLLNLFFHILQVPIEVERLIENDLVLEQFLSAASPILAGFRLDGFSAIKHRFNHSPSSDLDVGGRNCLIEERLISPAVLYIQVCAVQVSEMFAVVLLNCFP